MKTTFLSRFFSVLVLGAAALQFSCSHVEPLPPPDPSAVAAVTAGSISQQTPIHVVFNELQDITRPIAPGVFQVRGEAGDYQKGVALWEDEWTLGFVPSSPLRAGVHYTAYVTAAGTAQAAAPFSFDFTVEPLSLNVTLDPLQLDGDGNALVAGPWRFPGRPLTGT